MSELTECFERLAAEKRAASPLSTYRLQFNRNFHFEDARKLVPYLWRLGVSHCYASPLLKARPGSEHGYDIVDHNQLNPEIGSEEEFRSLVSELKAHGMGLILDIVPNHMGVGHGTNPWWQDVLQNGRASAYADFFDIDWEPLKPELRNKVLTPILGNPYGDDLEQGNIQVAFEDGRFVVKYSDRVLPVDPQTIPAIFATAEERRSAQSTETPGSDRAGVSARVVLATSRKSCDRFRASCTPPRPDSAAAGALAETCREFQRGSECDCRGPAGAEWNAG